MLLTVCFHLWTVLRFFGSFETSLNAGECDVDNLSKLNGLKMIETLAINGYFQTFTLKMDLKRIPSTPSEMKSTKALQSPLFTPKDFRTAAAHEGSLRCVGFSKPKSEVNFMMYDQIRLHHFRSSTNHETKQPKKRKGSLIE
uniref:Secreted protein n=1 Tax=Panagrellus redivivus TaxID=6233 RepID=A0A7E4VR39_PANRE